MGKAATQAVAEAAVVGGVRDREGTEVGPEVVAARESSAEEATERAAVEKAASWAGVGVRNREGTEAVPEAVAAAGATAEAEVRCMAPPQLLRT